MCAQPVYRTSPGSGIPGHTPGARPGGGAMRASGGRSFLPGRAVGLRPNMRPGNSHGLATCAARDREDAQSLNGMDSLNRIRQRRGYMDIGIWNVRSLGSKESELVEEAAKYRLDIVGVSE